MILKYFAKKSTNSSYGNGRFHDCLTNYWYFSVLQIQLKGSYENWDEWKASFNFTRSISILSCFFLLWLMKRECWVKKIATVILLILNILDALRLLYFFSIHFQGENNALRIFIFVSMKLTRHKYLIRFGIRIDQFYA